MKQQQQHGLNTFLNVSSITGPVLPPCSNRSPWLSNYFDDNLEKNGATAFLNTTCSRMQTKIRKG
jgi:hypothetical protein